MAKKGFPFKKGGGKGKAPPFGRRGPAEGSAAEEATESPPFEAQEDAGPAPPARRFRRGGLVEGSAAEERTESKAFEKREDARKKASDRERTKYAKGGLVR
jgi:hypothetical protein